MDLSTVGGPMDLATRIHGLPTSITGPGLRAVLDVIGDVLPDLEVVSVPSGTEVFDWTIPPEWNLREARLVGPDGEVVCDSSRSPLEVVGYSQGIHATMTLDDLQDHLHSNPDRPDDIPYRTSYYTPNWGFCLPDRVRRSLPKGEYQVLIDADHDPAGRLSYGEVVIGGGDREFVVTTHVCHPAQANDNISGLVTAVLVAQKLKPANLAVRFLFLPGGIGSIAWLAENEARLDHIVGGMSVACVGDSAPLRLKRTRDGDSVVDRVFDLVASDGVSLSDFEPYGFDERNFSSPAFAVPFGSLTRAGHGGYAEYHSSADDLTVLSEERLVEAAELIGEIVSTIDRNRSPRRVDGRGEPRLGKYGLYGSIGGLSQRPQTELALLWVANLSDGDHDLVTMAERSGLAFTDIEHAATLLEEAGVIVTVPPGTPSRGRGGVETPSRLW